MKTEDEIKLKLKDLILNRNIALIHNACELSVSYEEDIKMLEWVLEINEEENDKK